MPLVERATEPTTASQHRPSLDARYKALGVMSSLVDASLLTGVGQTLYVDNLVTNVAATDNGIVFLGSPCVQGVVTATASHLYGGGVAIGIADIWHKLDFEVAVRSVYSATEGQDTRSTLPVHEEEQKLDAAFAALMNYVPEEEEFDEREQRSMLKYRYPR